MDPSVSPNDSSQKTIEVIYKDEELLVVVKKPGWLVHPTNLDTRENQILLQACKEYSSSYLYPVHRLDKPTGGIVIFAKTKEAATGLGLAFQENRVAKKYLAVVRGYAPETMAIDALVKAKKDRRISASLKEPKSGRTDLNRLQTVELSRPVDRYATARYSLVCLTPSTGRRHQLRYHMKHISHPIIGDTNYGKNSHNRFFQDLDLPGLMLCNTELCFEHPTNQKQIQLKTKPPPHMMKALDYFGWRLV